ncbi:MAG TPA: asparagine synthase-related protein, partial [Pyrinomonadaceae bacterium]|nr:asparagine synthase-related protein [Pyrinomonadaceae bacterium]
MCGICGFLTSEETAPAAGVLEAMTERLHHRGPDDGGVWEGAAPGGWRVGLGARRLSIIDLSERGHMPMQTADGALCITYNGEVYNFRELRRELEALGHRFRSDTDTEVVLNAYRQWGPESLSRLNGMFAFAVWDERERELTLARDRLGVKPLFYAAAKVEGEGGESFVFASEAKAILASGLVKPELDLEGLNQQLTFLWTPDPHTLFRGIHRLPPAHVLKWRDGISTVREWWDVSFDEIEEGKSEDWWRERVLEGSGHEFRTDTDTEVMLEAFAEWGVAGSLARLNGMFAFAVWDERERELTLARDRLGVKPLFYAEAAAEGGGGESFVFASEAKAILASGLVKPELDLEGFNQQLTFLWTPDPHTLFRGIRRLPPAHVLTWREGEASVREWWDVSFDEVEEGRGEEWWRERVLETLDRVVGMEMVADVPLGAFLSGGVDSSVVA